MKMGTRQFLECSDDSLVKDGDVDWNWAFHLIKSRPARTLHINLEVDPISRERPGREV